MSESVVNPKQKSNLINQEVDGEVLILNNKGAEIHQLNEVASLIWSKCDGHHSIENIANILSTKYSVSPEQALLDVSEAISQFREKKLLNSIDEPS